MIPRRRLLALAVMAYAFIGPFDAGYQELDQDTINMFQSAQMDGSGDQR